MYFGANKKTLEGNQRKFRPKWVFTLMLCLRVELRSDKFKRISDGLIDVVPKRSANIKRDVYNSIIEGMIFKLSTTQSSVLLDKRPNPVYFAPDFLSNEKE